MKGFFLIDNFYDNADMIRKEALSQDFSKKHPKYPGMDSSKCFNYDEAMHKIRQCLGYETTDAKYSGFFRLSLHDNNYTKGHGVHIDNFDIAVIIYLSTAKSTQGFGTQFMRHIPSGLTDFYHIKKNSLLKPSWQSLTSEQIIKNIVDDMEKNDASLWEKYHEVDFIYNRALIMRGNMFHRLGQGFGINLTNGRLTHNFFLNLKK